MWPVAHEGRMTKRHDPCVAREDLQRRHARQHDGDVSGDTLDGIAPEQPGDDGERGDRSCHERGVDDRDAHTRR